MNDRVINLMDALEKSLKHAKSEKRAQANSINRALHEHVLVNGAIGATGDRDWFKNYTLGESSPST